MTVTFSTHEWEWKENYRCYLEFADEYRPKVFALWWLFRWTY